MAPSPQSVVAALFGFSLILLRSKINGGETLQTKANPAVPLLRKSRVNGISYKRA